MHVRLNSRAPYGLGLWCFCGLGVFLPSGVGLLSCLLFRVFRDLGAAMATAGQDTQAATRAVNKIPKTTANSGWPAVAGHAFLTVALYYCIFNLHHRIDCQAAVCFLWPMYPVQDPFLVCAASGSYLDTRGTANRTHRLRQPAGAGCRMCVCATVTCTHSPGHRLSPAPVPGSPSGATLATQVMPSHMSIGRIAPQSVAKTIFQLQAKLEPMTLEERGRTGLTSKATGNPFAFAERPAIATRPPQLLHPHTCRRYGTVAALETMDGSARRDLIRSHLYKRLFASDLSGFVVHIQC